jgi:multidrug efflux pump subunit AcrA (membrane-fusion protein)
MKRRKALIALLALATVGLLAGCGGTSTTAPAPTEEVPVVAQAEGPIVAEAVIEPARWGELSFEIAGQVIEVAVQQGDAVAEGDGLVRLGTTDLERAVAQAELDLRQAQLALDQLQEPADEADVRQAEHAINQASADLQAAQLGLTAVGNSTLVNESLEDAQDAFEEAERWYQYRLEQYEQGEVSYWYVERTQEDYDDALLALDRVQQQADAQLQSAQSDVTRAYQAYQEAQDALDRLLEGPDAQELEAAQVDVQRAELALDDARGNLEDATLRAPFAGTVTRLDVEPADRVAAGQIVLVLATIDQLEARTIDLTELDVARVTAEQSATVTVDALPDVSLAGHVVRIGLQSEDYRGDVTYPVTVGLDEPAPGLRWGMTAVVEIVP